VSEKRNPAVPGLRERKRAALKKRLVDAAIDLYLERGYQNTRIEDITAAVDVSRRTFFHYFSAKDDVVTGWFALHADCLREAFLARPADEPIWDSLRESCHTLFLTYGISRERAIGLRQLVHTEPALFARKYDFYLRVQAELTPVVQAKLLQAKSRRPASASLLAHVLVRAALAAQDAASEARARGTERGSPRVLLERAFALARPAALDAPQATAAIIT
jgi:AcrR family transcriptional regulator